MTHRFLGASLALVFAIAPTAGAAQSMPAPAAEVPMLDPYVPPAARPKSLKIPAATEGTSLEAQVDRKLRARFDAAANDQGFLTREQARAAGLGAIAEQFAAIDREGRGAIRFEDYQRHLQEQRAARR